MVTEVDRAITDFDADEQEVITRYLTRVAEAYRGHSGPSDRPRTWRADAPSAP
jgi:hypothetical protein